MRPAGAALSQLRSRAEVLSSHESLPEGLPDERIQLLAVGFTENLVDIEQDQQSLL